MYVSSRLNARFVRQTRGILVAQDYYAANTPPWRRSSSIAMEGTGLPNR